MEGQDAPPEARGIIPRVFEHIFAEIVAGASDREFLVGKGGLQECCVARIPDQHNNNDFAWIIMFLDSPMNSFTCLCHCAGPRQPPRDLLRRDPGPTGQGGPVGLGSQRQVAAVEGNQ